MLSGMSTSLNGWDVSNAGNFQSMFRGSSYNAPLSAWDVSSATKLQSLFMQSDDFNQDISMWDTSSNKSTCKNIRPAPRVCMASTLIY